MNSFIFFTYKELSEQVKTYKGLVIAVVLLIFGMTSPLLAKLTPDMLKMAGLGASLQIPAPTYLDAYAQFFKNIGQMVLIVLMFVYAGSISGEVTKGTAALMLTKRLSRGGFVLAKFLSAVAVWTVSYAVSAAVCIFYTVYLFPAGNR